MSYDIATGHLPASLTQPGSVTSADGAATIQTKEPAATDMGTGTGITDGDSTSLSPLGGLVSQALGDSADSDVRLDKVASLQQAISSGDYSVSSSDVADKLVQSLLGSR